MRTDDMVADLTTAANALRDLHDEYVGTTVRADMSGLTAEDMEALARRLDAYARLVQHRPGLLDPLAGGPPAPPAPTGAP